MTASMTANLPAGLAVQTVPIASLKPDPANARTHDARNLDTIRASLRRFGQQKPIVIDQTGVVIAGSGTLLAAEAEGWSEIGVVVSDLIGADRTAYAIADNRSAELAAWDDDALAKMLEQLQGDPGIDAAVTGFDAEEIEAMLGAFNVNSVDAPSLASGDRAPFQQMTFTLSDAQAGAVKAAIARAKTTRRFVDTGNENSNGNALARIAEAYVGPG